MSTSVGSISASFTRLLRPDLLTFSQMSVTAYPMCTYSTESTSYTSAEAYSQEMSEETGWYFVAGLVSALVSVSVSA